MASRLERVYKGAVALKDLLAENKKGAILGAALVPPLIYLTDAAIKLYFGVDTRWPPVDLNQLPQIHYSLSEILLWAYGGAAVQKILKFVK